MNNKKEKNFPFKFVLQIVLFKQINHITRITLQLTVVLLIELL